MSQNCIRAKVCHVYFVTSSAIKPPNILIPLRRRRRTEQERCRARATIFSLVTLFTIHQTTSMVLSLTVIAPCSCRSTMDFAQWLCTSVLQVVRDFTVNANSVDSATNPKLALPRINEFVCFQPLAVHIVPQRIPQHVILEKIHQRNRSTWLRRMHCWHMSFADSALIHGIILMSSRNLSSCKCHILSSFLTSLHS